MGRPKALLPVAQSTVVARVLAALVHSQVAARLVVVRQADAALRAAAEAAGATVITPEVDPPQMREAVEHALRHVATNFAPLAADAWLLCPVDYALLDPVLVGLLIEAWNRHRPAILVPTYKGRRGHPVFFRWDLAQEAARLPRDKGLNALVANHAAQALEFETGNAAVVTDLDTPEDYARLAGQ